MARLFFQRTNKFIEDEWEKGLAIWTFENKLPSCNVWINIKQTCSYLCMETDVSYT